MLREYFHRAEKLAEEKQTVLFIDEIDGICRARTDTENDSGSRRLKTYMFSKIQGFIKRYFPTFNLRAFRCLKKFVCCLCNKLSWQSRQSNAVKN